MFLLGEMVLQYWAEYNQDTKLDGIPFEKAAPPYGYPTVLSAHATAEATNNFSMNWMNILEEQ